MGKKMNRWNSGFYDKACDYVSEYGKEVLLLLNPKPNERILDLGCGTGHLSYEIFKKGSKVIGIDNSVAMIQQAKRLYPKLTFDVKDAQNFQLKQKFDAVFSNAALHWMLKPKKVISCVYDVLKDNGRFVFEMGGKNNVQKVLSAITSTYKKFGVKNISIINYYPSIGEYTPLLEKQGFKVTFAQLIDRPTKLEGKEGLRNWVRAFRTSVLERIPKDKHNDFFEQLEKTAAKDLYHHKTWWADYVRLRVVAVK